MRIEIVCFDNDYHCVAYIETKEFSSIEEANQYCKDNSWKGESFWIAKNDCKL